MTFKEYLRNANKVLADNPELGELPVIVVSYYAGRDFNKVSHYPTFGNYVEFEYNDEFTESETINTNTNAVCLN